MGQVKSLAITAPFNEEIAGSLRAGQLVSITGYLLLAYDVALKRLVDCVESGEKLPCDLHNEVLYYASPSEPRSGMILGSAAPGFASHMDKYAPMLIYMGLKGMIGRGVRSEEVVRAIKAYKVPYLAALGGAGALIAKSIKSYKVIAWPDLGKNALARVQVVDFPAICAMDALGNDFYTLGPASYSRT